MPASRPVQWPPTALTSPRDSSRAARQLRARRHARLSRHEAQCRGHPGTIRVSEASPIGWWGGKLQRRACQRKGPGAVLGARARTFAVAEFVEELGIVLRRYGFSVVCEQTRIGKFEHTIFCAASVSSVPAPSTAVSRGRVHSTSPSAGTTAFPFAQFALSPARASAS